MNNYQFVLTSEEMSVKIVTAFHDDDDDDDGDNNNNNNKSNRDDYDEIFTSLL